MVEYNRSEELEELLANVIAKYDEFEELRDSYCRIGCQYSSQEKKSNGKIVFADTMKVNPKLKQFVSLDFVITFYEPNCEEFTEEQLERIMFHEALHIGYDGGENFFIKPHDVEDFRACIEKWGIDWVFEDLGSGEEL